MSTVARAAWAILVAKYSSSPDIVYGTTLSGRNVPVGGIEDMPGPTITTVPLRIHVDPAQAVSLFLESIHHQATEMIPFEHFGLQNIKNVSSDAKRACDFQTLLVVQPPYRPNSDDGPCSNIENHLAHGTDGISVAPNMSNTYDLTVECTPTADGLHISSTFDSRVVDEQQMERIINQFAHLLLQLCDEDSHNKPAGDLCVISPEDLDEIWCWNESLPPSVEACVHSAVDKSVLRRPRASAISSWDGNLSYSELDSLSNQVAHCISSHVKPGVIVPVCFEKSRWAVIAMLGILKAGCACAPLDPFHPASRHMEVLTATTAELVVASATYADLFSDKLQNVVIVGPEQFSQNSEFSWPKDKLQPRAAPGDKAFIVFTSGTTTGKPKGIVISHRSLCTSAAAHGAAMQIGSQSRVFQFAAYTFDVSIGEIFTTLMRGGCVCIPSEYARFNQLSATMNDMRVTHAYFTPTVLSLLKPEEVKTLRFLSVGGEALRQDTVALWAGRERIQMLNLYGPAETSIWCTYKGRLMVDSDPADIGSPIGCLCWVVNPANHHELMPIGSVGELLIEGPLLAMGYLGERDLTSKSFVENPAWQVLEGSGRQGPFYKSGDLVRYNSEGSLIFMGRKDTQVKLRGQRVELGEIEENLADAFGFSHVAAVVPTAGPFQKQLVGVVSLPVDSDFTSPSADMHIVPKKRQESATAKLAEIHTSLLEKLPTHMVPTIWAFVTHLPLLVSGKLDRTHLLSWLANITDDETAVIKQSTAKRSPNAIVSQTVTPLEEQIVRLCRQSLGQPDINVEDSFLGLGGDSMTALRFMGLCRIDGVSFQLHHILQSKSLRELARHAEISSNTPKAETNNDEAATSTFSLSPIQALHFQTSPNGNNMFTQSRLVRFLEHVSPEQIYSALGSLVARHAMLRAHFHQIDSGLWVQRVGAVAANPRYIRHHEIASTNEMSQLIKSAQAGLNVHDGPLFTVELFNLSSERFALIVVHHLIFDFVSWDILLRELEEHLLTGHVSGPKPFPFQTWCKLQSEQVGNSERIAKPLPLDHCRYWNMLNIPNVYEDATTMDAVIGEGATSTLFKASNHALKTEAVEVLLSALAQSFFGAFTDRSAVEIFNEHHGRDPQGQPIDLSNTIGWFTGIQRLSIRTQVGDTNLDVVRRVKDMHKQASTEGFPHIPRAKSTTSSSTPDTPMEILFNFHGYRSGNEPVSPCFRTVPLGEIGSAEWPWSGDRMALFEISALVESSKLRVSFTFNQRMSHQPQIKAWVESFERDLSSLLQELSQSEQQFSLSDFPLIPLTYSRLNYFSSKILPERNINPADVEDIYPCSPVQEGILLSQAKDSMHYSTRITFEVLCRGADVNFQRLEEAWQHVVNCNPILRTIFLHDIQEDGRAAQLVLRNVHADMTKLTFRTSTDCINNLSSYPIMAKATNRPPHQLLVCTDDNGRAFCRLEMDHTITDGGSTPILLRFLRDAYKGIDLKPLGSPHSPYREYVSYIQQQPKHTAYWNDYLGDIKPCHFPLDTGRFQLKDELHSVAVPMQDRSLLGSFCRKHKVTESMFFMACWSLLLQCYVNSESTCFGYLVSDRDLPIYGIQEALGPLIDLLPCRVRAMPTTTFLETLKAIQADFGQALQCRSTSMAEIQRGLDLNGQALFNTAMSVQGLVELGDSTGESIETKILDAHDPTEVSNSFFLKMFTRA